MKFLVPFILLFVYLNSNGQAGPTRNWVDSDLKYTDSKGNWVKFINSFPRGGGVVYKKGKKYSYVVFWSRFYNRSAVPLELKVKFPEVVYFKSSESSIQIVIPKETMSMDKVQLLDFGLTNMQSLLNDTSNQINILRKKIKPNEDCIFYTVVFIHKVDWGPVRAKFVLKDRELFYKISMGPDTTMIHCGDLYFKNY